MGDIPIEEILLELEQRRDRYPPDRYPVQYATVCFHLGSTLIQARRPEAAVGVLEEAGSMFDRDGLALERAKTLNMQGIAHREIGDLQAAERCFSRAAAMFEDLGEAVERAAALYNLGLVQRDLLGPSGSVAALTEALSLFEVDASEPQASAAARELGMSLLSSGEPAKAIPLLERAVTAALSAADDLSFGNASNALGLAYLGSDRFDDAVEAFREAAAAHPRSVRPEPYAMAKANLALALERSGRPGGARLAALQAKAIPTAPEPVVEQLDGILHRVGSGPGALWEALEEQSDGGIVREELLRWNDLDASQIRAEAKAWIDLQAGAHDGEAKAELILNALLESSPKLMENVISALIAAASDVTAADTWTLQMERAMTRFHIPQWERLRSIFNERAEALGSPLRWT